MHSSSRYRSVDKWLLAILQFKKNVYILSMKLVFIIQLSSIEKCALWRGKFWVENEASIKVSMEDKPEGNFDVDEK